MDNPNDLIEVGGGALGGAGVLGLIMQFIRQSNMKEIRDSLTELRNEQKAAIHELKDHFKEQMSDLKDAVREADRRHDNTLKEVQELASLYKALHRRIDEMEEVIKDLKRERT